LLNIVEVELNTSSHFLNTYLEQSSLFERHEGGNQAILVHVDFPQGPYHQQSREDKQEFIELVRSAGIEQLAMLTLKRDKPDAKFFVGTGKIEELSALVDTLEAPLVLFNHSLSPAQERNIEAATKCRVVDRTGLILDIFAQRAQSYEGKLQVELAQLKHMSTRLIRGWTHLERQKGGIGLRGPGETQLETDRRLLRGRIKWIESRLNKVDKQRQQSRQARKKAHLPTLSLTGYTNAGKSTLFNLITEADVFAADQLFATLDPVIRKVHWPESGQVVLADTVGFIRHLPHDVVAAFKATLQESKEASLLLHIIDASDERRDENIKQVYRVLEEIGADSVPTLEIYNKIDTIPGAVPRIDYDNQDRPVRVWVSAVTGAGLDLLQEAIGIRLGEVALDYLISLPPQFGKARAQLYQAAAVIDESISDDGLWNMHIQMSRSEWEQIKRNTGVDLSLYRQQDHEQPENLLPESFEYSDFDELDQDPIDDIDKS